MLMVRVMQNSFCFGKSHSVAYVIQLSGSNKIVYAYTC